MVAGSGRPAHCGESIERSWTDGQEAGVADDRVESFNTGALQVPEEEQTDCRVV